MQLAILNGNNVMMRRAAQDIKDILTESKAMIGSTSQHFFDVEVRTEHRDALVNAIQHRGDVVADGLAKAMSSKLTSVFNDIMKKDLDNLLSALQNFPAASIFWEKGSVQSFSDLANKRITFMKALAEMIGLLRDSINQGKKLQLDAQSSLHIKGVLIDFTELELSADTALAFGPFVTQMADRVRHSMADTLSEKLVKCPAAAAMVQRFLGQKDKATRDLSQHTNIHGKRVLGGNDAEQLRKLTEQYQE